MEIGYKLSKFWSNNIPVCTPETVFEACQWLYILSAAFLRRQHWRRKVLWEIVRPGLGLHPTPERHLQLGPGGDQQQALTERSTLQVEHALVLKPNQQTPTTCSQTSLGKTLLNAYLFERRPAKWLGDSGSFTAFFLVTFMNIWPYVHKTFLKKLFLFSSLTASVTSFFTAWDQLLDLTVIFRPNIDTKGRVFFISRTLLLLQGFFFLSFFLFKLMLEGPVN